jgi:ubiquinone/menaquinone biosynthesis C-methylase UbiE
MIFQLEPEQYFSKNYDTKYRFISYWHQLDEIMTLEPESILEIGKGNGFVSNYLKSRGLKINTVDIDKRLNPNAVGSVLFIPFSDKAFEVVAAFEVLEHLPFKDFSRALAEIYRVSRKNVVLSLPDFTRAYRIYFQLPKLGEFSRLILFPRRKKIKHVFDGEHYWEIGKDGYPLQRIMDGMRQAGFTIKKTYRIFEAPYYRFFVLTKRPTGAT